jgi:hypothetical protein
MDIHSVSPNFRKLAIVCVEVAERRDQGRLRRTKVYLGIEDEGFGFGNNSGVLKNGDSMERSSRHICEIQVKWGL